MADERSGRGNIERTLELLWRPEPTRGRGPSRSLSVLAIVDRAIAIADRRGLHAVSMRSIAADLEVGTMTLYRYIPSKAELLDLMLDRVNQPVRGPSPGDWRTGLERMAHEMWRIFTTHTWVPQVDQARPVLGPNAVRALDIVMESLRDSGLTDQEKVSAVVTIESFVLSLARTTNAMASAEEQTAITHEDFWSAQESSLVAAMESGRFPHMADLADDAFGSPMDDVFEFGLARFLDGIEALLGRRTDDA